MHRLRTPYGIAFVTVLIAAVAFALADAFLENGPWLWSGLFTEKNTLDYFCEPAIVDALIRQPVDTYTNLGFLFTGTVMLAHGVRDRRTRPDRFVAHFPGWSLLFGAACIFTFLGSSFFHASLTRFAEWLDLAAVYETVWVPVCFNLHRLLSSGRRGRLPAWPFLLLFLAIWLFCTVTIFRITAWYLVPAALVLIGGTMLAVQLRLRPRGGWRWIILSTVLSGFAIMWFVFDVKRVLCFPDGLLQPHGVWHLMNAAAVFCFYRFMRLPAGEGCPPRNFPEKLILIPLIHP